MPPASLSERRTRIRLPLVAVASAAGVDKHTAHRALNGIRDTRSSKLRAIEEAVVSEELALLAHLVRLHPAEAREAVLAA